MYNKQFRRTVLFLAAYAIFTLTPLGAALGFVALPAACFAYLIPCILLYMVLATSLKKPVFVTTASCCKRRCSR